MQKPLPSGMKLLRRVCTGCTIAALLSQVLPVTAQATSIWNPTLLVNTESFNTIDEGDGSTDVELRFGSTAGGIQKLIWDISASRFDFSRSVMIHGDLTATGSLSILGTMSGANLHVDEQALINKLSVSGATILDGSTTINNDLTVRGTMSGSTVHADRTLSASGALLIEGAGIFHSTLSATGAIKTDADLTINADNGDVDAVLTFGNDAGVETIKFNNTTNQFEFTDDVSITGNIAATGNITGSGYLSIEGTLGVDGAATFGSTITVGGVTYTFPGADGGASGRVLKTNGAGQLSWSTDTDTNTNAETLCGADQYLDGDGNCVDVIEESELDTLAELNSQITDATILDQTAGDNRYVNTSGDSMTGSLTISNGGGLNASGTLITNTNVTLNSDNEAADAIITFGNDAGAETLKFNDTTNRFEMSDDLAVSGNLSGSTLTVDGNVTLHGVTYTLPTTSGVNGQVLTTAGDGSLSWASTTVGVGSGGVVFLSPEYPHAVYFGSGANNIGQLSNSYDATNKENYYHWTSTKATLQDYWTIVRVRIPNNFSVWDAAGPITVRYRTADASDAVNYVNIKLLDTTGAAVALTGGDTLSSANTWTTATITGPEAAGTYTKDGYITLLIKLATTSAGSADIGWIQLNMETSAP
ncbi:MAG: hypothetical protein WCS85_01545 [Candidatus Peribacteraceae bacterium]